MKDCREEWYDAGLKVAVTVVDVTTAAQELARGHLCGPTSAHYLAEALAAVALLGAETSEKDEVVSLQMKCDGPLGGLNVECSAEGALRGYTEKKILDEFDGMGTPKDSAVLGARQIQVTRSVPGRILSQGISNSLDGYLAGSLQRRAVVRLAAEVTDEVQVVTARGLLVEALPDCDIGAVPAIGQLMDAKTKLALTVASRNLLNKLGLGRAELKKSSPLKFMCRCSPDRAVAMLGALSDEEKKNLPPTIDITCHMCGRTFTVKTR